MRIGSCFSGIGGLELGLEWAGLGRVLWQIEIDPYCQQVLAKWWPDAKRFGNIESVNPNDLDRVDLICGGFPCQDVSGAGKGAGLAGDRSGLWAEFARIVWYLRPEWVVVENVASGARKWVDSVRSDLGRLGYESIPIPISSALVGAPHERARVFIVAHRDRRAIWDGEQWRSGGRPWDVQDGGKAVPVDAGAAMADRCGNGSGLDRTRLHAGLGGLNDETRAEPHGRNAPLAQAVGPADQTREEGASRGVVANSRKNGSVLCGSQQRAVRPPRPGDLDGWDQYLGAGGFEPGILRSTHGLPTWLARARIGAIGNSVDPEVAETIGYVIRELVEARNAGF